MDTCRTNMLVMDATVSLTGAEDNGHAVEESLESGISVEQLFRDYAPPLLGYVRTILLNEDLAEDALQETFLRLVRHVDKLKRVSNLRAYLFRIARNEAFRVARREQRRHERYETLTLSPLIEPLPDAHGHEERIARLEQALKRIPGKQREVVFLKCMQNLTFAEIAGVLKISQNTAASRYRYALERLRRLMEATS